MSNLTNNRINTTATAAQITAVKTALQTINTNLPFLIGLTKEERIALPAIDVNNKAFAEDAISAGLNNASLIPAYVSVATMQNDMALFNQLDEIAGIVNQLLEKIEDTKLLAGSEAYVSALTLYRLFGAAAEAGVPGSDTIVAQLKTRFAGQGGAAKAPVNPNI
ncbi:hypothetical protein AAGV28_00405 [Flavobacterium sp. FZUC8N2.13]|uniref:Uncharacterized protein n=1 Tax=Flavobacterium zubiriense TaxID=3138075 RepID=A0ABV4T6X5_9FLAO